MDDISLKLFEIDSHKLQQQGRSGEENTATEDKVLRNLCKGGIRPPPLTLLQKGHRMHVLQAFFKSDRVMQ